MAVVGDSVQLQYGSITSVKVHPLVLFAITDHFMRRTEQQKRVLGLYILYLFTICLLHAWSHGGNFHAGTLLGFCGEGVAHILNTIPVRHTEKQIGKVGTDLNSHTHMKKLYQRVNNKEDIVGWYVFTRELATFMLCPDLEQVSTRRTHLQIIHGFRDADCFLLFLF